MFGFTQFRVVGGDLGHRAVVLADLYSAACPGHCRSVTVSVECLGECLGRALNGVLVTVGGADIRQDRPDPSAGELLDGFPSPHLAEGIEGLRREFVVGVPELGSPPVREAEGPGRSATSRRGSCGPVTVLRDLAQPLRHEDVQVAADAGG